VPLPSKSNVKTAKGRLVTEATHASGRSIPKWDSTLPVTSSLWGLKTNEDRQGMCYYCGKKTQSTKRIPGVGTVKLCRKQPCVVPIEDD